MSSAVLPRAGIRPAQVLLPFRHTDWVSRVVGIVAATVPPLGTTLWLALIGGHVWPISILIGCLVALAAVVGRLIATSRIELTADGLRRWSVPARDHHIARADVARVVLVDVFVRDSLRTTKHLYLVGHDGRTIIAMSGRWWADSAIAAVARHLDAHPETVAEPLTAPELRRSGIVIPAWRDRHPALMTAIATVLVVVFSVAVTYVTASSI